MYRGLSVGRLEFEDVVPVVEMRQQMEALAIGCIKGVDKGRVRLLDTAELPVEAGASGFAELFPQRHTGVRGSGISSERSCVLAGVTDSAGRIRQRQQHTMTLDGRERGSSPVRKQSGPEVRRCFPRQSSHEATGARCV